MVPYPKIAPRYVSSSNRNTKWLQFFLVPSPGFRHILIHLLLLQGSLPKNKGSPGNNFSRRICQRGSKIHSSSKKSLLSKNSWIPKNKKFQKSFRRRKMKNCKSSETRFAEVSCRSEPSSRGKRTNEKTNERRTNERTNERTSVRTKIARRSEASRTILLFL